MADCGGLENRCPFLGPRVQIPASPPFSNGDSNQRPEFENRKTKIKIETRHHLT